MKSSGFSGGSKVVISSGSTLSKYVVSISVDCALMEGKFRGFGRERELGSW